MKNVSLKGMTVFFGMAVALVLAGCTTVQNRRQPFAAYVGREVALVRPCVLEEYLSGQGGPLDSYWENGQPTEFVLDDRLFTPAAKVVPGNVAGFNWKLYPAGDYRRRQYFLKEAGDEKVVVNNGRTGPYRVHQLPAGKNLEVPARRNFCRGRSD